MRSPDGREAGRLERPGRIALDPNAPAFIGSSEGVNEHFQGRLDDLRVYSQALTPEQIAALHDAGRAVLAERVQALEARMTQSFQPAPTFAETLAAMRRMSNAGRRR